MRRRSKSILVIFICVLLFAGFFALYLWPRDVVELDFSTYEKAVAAGAIENEALPSFIPKSATNIHSLSNLDSNTAVVTFNFGPDFDQYLTTQKSAPPKSAASLRIRGHDHVFGNPQELTYIPKVSKNGNSHKGTLLINRTLRRALYFE